MINYYLLTKPGIVLGNLITVAAGFLLASKGHMHYSLFFWTLLGMAFIMASACVFNNYLDRQLDRKMKRTQSRPLASGLISEKKALTFATLMLAAGNALLYAYSNLLTVFIADVGFFIYVILYTLWKGKTIYGTAIGSLAGATPPVIGYCAVSNQFDMGALILFVMMVLWQMPHFFAIAITHFDDYVRANIPVLPVKKGIFRTKIHMIVYILAFALVAMLLTWFQYTGYFYLAAALVLSLSWMALALWGFANKENDTQWGRRMFQLSLFLITVLCLVIPFDVI